MTPQTTLRQIEEAATLLGDTATAELARIALDHAASTRLRLLVIGLTGTGRCTLVNALLEQADLLPVSPVPKALIPIVVRHGPSVAVEAATVDGSRRAIPADRLRPVLLDRETDTTALDIAAPAELLQTTELRLEPLERSPVDHERLIAGHDFILFVLNANALLSEPERNFVREIARVHGGLDRLAVVINQMDLIPEEERGSLIEHVQTFLGPFDTQPPILDLAAGQARRSLAAGGSPDVAGFGALRTLVGHDLLERHRALRGAALDQVVARCVTSLSATAEQQESLLAMSEEEIMALKARIDERQEWLQGRIRRAQQRIAAFMTTLIKEQFLREIESFGALVERRLPDEILAVDDLATIRRYLPGYLETIWSSFLNHQAIAVRSKLMEEATAIGRLVQRDLVELVEGIGGAQLGSFDELKADTIYLNTFIMPKRGSHRASSAATGLSLVGLVALLWSFPLGLTALGAGYAIRTYFKGDIARAEKQAMVSSAQTANHELVRRIKQQVDAKFAELAKNLEQEVAALYERGLTTIKQSLDEGLARRQDLQTRREQLDELRRHTIPGWERDLAGAF